MLNNHLLGILLICAMACPLYSMSGRVEKIPLKTVAEIRIRDGEFLRYSGIQGGEKVRDVYFVSKWEDNKTFGKCLHVYYDAVDRKYRKKLPGNIRDFAGYYLISRATGSSVESRYDVTYLTEKPESRGVRDIAMEGRVFEDMHIDLEHSEAVYAHKYWNGYELESKKIVVPVKPEYPLLGIESGTLINTRFLDLTNKGIFYYLVPDFAKEPIPTVFQFAGKETIQTKAGTFKTVKVRFVCPDPFIAQLMLSYTREMAVWIEDAPERRVIRFQTPVETHELEEISNVTIP